MSIFVAISKITLVAFVFAVISCVLEFNLGIVDTTTHYTIGWIGGLVSGFLIVSAIDKYFS